MPTSRQIAALVDLVPERSLTSAAPRPATTPHGGPAIQEKAPPARPKRKPEKKKKKKGLFGKLFGRGKN